MFDVELLPTLDNDLDWTVNYGSSVLSLVVGLAGDYNADQVVDAADYIMLRKLNAAPEQLENWRTNFGPSSAGGGSGGVPEPGSAVLVLAALATVCVTSRASSHIWRCKSVF